MILSNPLTDEAVTSSTDHGKAEPGGPGAARPGADAWEVDGVTMSSRVILGTGGMSSLESLRSALIASAADMATVAVRRVDPAARGSLLDLLHDLGLRVLPNTAGCYTASEAVLTAQRSRPTG
jgi:thiazole synthase